MPFNLKPIGLSALADVLVHHGNSAANKGGRSLSEVVRNKKRRDARAQRTAEGRSHCANFADEIQCVINLLHHDRFVRSMELSTNHVPSVVLYTDRQIKEIAAFCFGANDHSVRSVMGFDKTYNLGAVYKNQALLRRRTNDHPIFMGPIFIHGHSDFQTYHYFFSHLSACFSEYFSGLVTIGSDDEAAMRKAMEHNFPSARFVVCNRHLRDNVTRKLDAVMGARTQARKTIVDGLFGDSGLASADNIIAFDAAVTKFLEKGLAAAPEDIRNYVSTRIVTLLRLNLSSGRPRWSNNNREAINHVLKQSVQGQPQQLPMMIGHF